MSYITQAHVELNREPCENQGRARRCDRGRTPQNATVLSEKRIIHFSLHKGGKAR